MRIVKIKRLKNIESKYKTLSRLNEEFFAVAKAFELSKSNLLGLKMVELHTQCTLLEREILVELN